MNVQYGLRVVAADWLLREEAGKRIREREGGWVNEWFKNDRSIKVLGTVLEMFQKNILVSSLYCNTWIAISFYFPLNVVVVQPKSIKVCVASQCCWEAFDVVVVQIQNLQSQERVVFQCRYVIYVASIQAENFDSSPNVRCLC